MDQTGTAVTVEDRGHPQIPTIGKPMLYGEQRAGPLKYAVVERPTTTVIDSHQAIGRFAVLRHQTIVVQHISLIWSRSARAKREPSLGAVLISRAFRDVIDEAGGIAATKGN